MCLESGQSSKIFSKDRMWHRWCTIIKSFLSSKPSLRRSTRPDSRRPGPPRDSDHLPGPRAISFADLRYRVDRAKQYVSWMGWGLYLGFDRDMGILLWDIRFKDERLIYEVSDSSSVINP